MHGIAENVKKHRVALLMALAMGLIYASHHFFIPRFLDDRKEIYEPVIWAEYGDESLLYAPRAHDAFLHFGVRGDFSLAEYPKSPGMLPMLNPLLLGGLGRLFGSMRAGIIASDIVFPSVIFFIVYLVLYEIGAGAALSVVFSTIFLITPEWGMALPPIHSFQLHTIAQAVIPFFAKNDPLYFSHFEEPKLTFVFFAFCVYAIICALKRQHRKDTILAGASFGLLFYTYLYDWATMITALGLMALFFLAAKDYRRFKIIAAIVGIGLLVSGYYWINFSLLRSIANGKDVFVRLGGEFSHHIRWGTVWKNYLRAAGLTGLLWIWLRHRANEAVIVLSALLLSYAVVVNEQVITGFNVQPDHWYRVQFLPVSISMFLLGLWIYERYAKQQIKKYAHAVSYGSCDSSAVSYGFLLYFFITAFAGQYAYARSHATAFAVPNSYAEALAWLNTTTRPGSVVGTLSFNENLDVQLYTHNKIFTPFGLSTIAPEDELWRRFMIMGRLWGITPEQFAMMINRDGGAYYLFGDEYGIHTFDANFFPYHWRVPDDVLARETKTYADNYAKHPLVIPFQLDYLFVDAQDFPKWKEPRNILPALKKVYDNGRIRIFSVH